MKSNPNRTEPTYYGNMPAEVRYCKLLSPSEKVLYCEFAALSNKTGYAWAANSYFAELYDVEPTTVSEWISNLSRYGFIKIYNPKGRARKIALTNILRKNVKAIDKPKVITEAQPSGTPETNNTSINTTSNIPSESQKTDLAIPLFSFSDYISGVLRNSKETKQWHRYFAAYFLKRKGLTFNSAQAVEGAMKRHFRSGKELGQFVGDMDRVKRAFDEAENLTIRGERVNWGLETVLKQLTK